MATDDEYRTWAMQDALALNGGRPTPHKALIETAAAIEDYLRNGLAPATTARDTASPRVRPVITVQVVDGVVKAEDIDDALLRLQRSRGLA